MPNARSETRLVATALVATASKLAAVSTLALLVPGCGIGRVTYLSPRVSLPEATYGFQAIDGGQSKAPVAVRLSASGVGIAVWAPQSGFSADHPFPVCVRSREVVLLPPIPWVFTTEVGTAAFDIALSIDGEDVSLDPSRVGLRVADGPSHRALRYVENAAEGTWRFEFDVGCAPDSTFDLEIDGVSRNGAPVSIPAIRFAPASEWRMEAI